MNGSHALWTLLFGAITAVLLVAPFYPAWREWRHPSDDHPLELMTEAPPQAEQAQQTERASDPLWAGVTPQTDNAFAQLGKDPIRQQLLMDLPHARPWGDRGWRVQGDCHLPDNRRLAGPLVVIGQLTCGANSLVEGDVKVHGDVFMGPASLIQGALFAHAVTLSEGAQVLGPVWTNTQGAVS